MKDSFQLRSGSRFGFVHDLFGFKQADDQIEASTHGQSVSYEYILEKNPGYLSCGRSNKSYWWRRQQSITFLQMN